LTDVAAREALIEIGARIRSMALVHEQLYQSENFSTVNLRNYFSALISHLRDSFDRSGNVQAKVSAPGVKMGFNYAVPCGLFITELVTNAYKYAFPETNSCFNQDECLITVKAERDGTAYSLSVADNGVGLFPDLDWRNTKTRGLLLVKMLGEHQLQGRVELDRTAGTCFLLRFEPKPIENGDDRLRV
jgi:two-component sensor histidine kinase